MKDLTVANDVPFGEDRESALCVPGCLDVEFLVAIDVLGELSEEIVGDDPTLVVGETVVTGIVYLEAVVTPNYEFAPLRSLPR